MELELRFKEHSLFKRMPVIPGFKTQGQFVISEDNGLKITNILSFDTVDLSRSRWIKTSINDTENRTWFEINQFRLLSHTKSQKVTMIVHLTSQQC